MRTSAIATTRVRPIAAFPLYDFPWLRAETEAFWYATVQQLRGAGLRELPTRLTRSEDYSAAWRNSHLLLGQACGYPLMKQFRITARIVATPVYTAPGCKGAWHRSVFIARGTSRFATLSDLRGGICAVNGFDSNTGMNLLRAAIAPLADRKPFFRSIVISGSHLASIKAIVDGRADLAAIDCVSFAHLQRFVPTLTECVRPIGQSMLVPAPPFITASTTDDTTVAILRRALAEVAANPQLVSLRAALLIGGFEFVAEADYELALRLEHDAAAAGYPELC
jgi:ABC-type phosphate/phosphonate transport system substrate-binding protein